MTYTAHLVRRALAKERSVWEIYVPVISRSAADWPGHMWPEQRTTVPTAAERRSELERLGYTTVKDEPWEWIEDEDAEGVTLIAISDVVPLDGAS